MRGGFVLALAVALWWVCPAVAAEVESSCVSCHADEEDEELAAPVEEWRHSVHAEAGVSCDGCHGGNPFEEDEELSMDEDEAGFLGSPSWREQGSFCGSCHGDIRDSYATSVMASVIEEGETVAVCTTCHMPEGHDIRPADTAEILTEDRCSECHDGQRAVALREVLVDLDAEIAHAEHGLEALRGRIDTSSLDREVASLRQRAVVIAHTYDLERISQVADGARARLAGVDETTEALAAESTFRRRLGFGVVLTLSLTAAAAARWKTFYPRRTD